MSSLENTLSTFLNELYSFINIESIGKLLEYYRLSAKLISPTNNSLSSSTPPTFTWEKQGGNSTYQNNLFIVVIKDPSGNIIHTSSALLIDYYTLSTQTWATIKSYGYSYVTWNVETYQTTTYTTGKYYSSTFYLYL